MNGEDRQYILANGSLSYINWQLYTYVETFFASLLEHIRVKKVSATPAGKCIVFLRTSFYRQLRRLFLSRML